jgi:hypothetical protein
MRASNSIATDRTGVLPSEDGGANRIEAGFGKSHTTGSARLAFPQEELRKCMKRLRAGTHYVLN